MRKELPLNASGPGSILSVSIEGLGLPRLRASDGPA